MLYERRETRFPLQARPVERDIAPTDFDLHYLQEKGWIWQPAEQGKTPCTALLYHDGLYVRTEQAVVAIPKEAILEFCLWVVTQTEWLQGASYQTEEYAERLECIYCRRNLPHTEEQHDKQRDIPSPIFYDDGISPDPIDGQW